MWARLASFVIRRRLSVILFIVVSTAFMAYESSKIQIAYDFAKIIPKDDSDYISYVNFKNKFGEDGSVLVIGLRSNQLFTEKIFSDFYNLSNEIEKVDGVEKVVSLTKIYTIDNDAETHKFALKPVFSRCPQNKKELDSIHQRIVDLKFYSGLLLNDSGNVTTIAVTLKKEKLDSRERIALVAEIERHADEFGKKNNIEIHYSGLPYIRTIYATKVRNELVIFTILSILITTIIMWLFFRSFAAVFYSLCVVIMGVVWTLGFVVLFNFKITLLIGIIPPLIVIIAIQNCIYLLNVYHQEFRSHGNKMLALTRLTSKNGLALFLTNVTTAVGFGVFNFTGSSLLDEFSIVSAVVIMAIYIISALFIPAVFTYIKAPDAKHTKHLDNPRLGNFMQWCVRHVFTKRGIIYFSTFILIVFSVVGLMRIKNVGFILDDIPKKNKVYTDLKFFEQNFHGVMPLEIQVTADKKQKFRTSLDALSKIDDLQNRLTKYNELSKSLSIVDMIKFATQALHNFNPDAYRMPVSEEMLAMQSYLSGTKKKNNLVKNLVDSNWQTARISVQMADIGSIETAKLCKEINKEIDTVFGAENYSVKLTGTSLIFLKGNDYLIGNLTGSMVLALIINSLLMAFLFLSWRMILISLIPNIIPLLITLGIMGYFNIHLKPSTIIIFSITYGITIDYTIHFLAKYRYYLRKNDWVISHAVSDTITESGVSIIYTSIILFCGFIIFAFSSFGGTVALGVLTSLALLTGMFMNLVLLPAILMQLEKRINMKKELEKRLVDFDGE